MWHNSDLTRDLHHLLEDQDGVEGYEAYQTIFFDLYEDQQVAPQDGRVGVGIDQS